MPAALTRLWTAWQVFWFRPVDARPLALMRVALAVLLLWSHAGLGRELWLLSADGPVDLVTAARSAAWRWSLLDHATTEPRLLALYALGFAPLVGMLLGWRSRTMALLALLVQVSVHHRNPWMQHGGDRVLRFATLYLSLSACGAAWSIDAWLEARRRRARGEGEASALVPAVSLRLVQIQTSVVYLMTGLAKSQGSQWAAGTALYYALSDSTFQRWPALSEAIVGSPVGQALCRLGTWVTLGWELAWPALVLWGPTRAAALAVGVGVHAGIFGLMMVGSFSPAMLWTYLAWLSPARLRGALERWQPHAGAPD